MNENIMKYKGYTAAIHYDDDDGILVGRVLGINDIIDFHGDSVKMLRKEFHVAIDEYIKACEKMGQKPEKPKSGKLLLRLPPEVHAGLTQVAEITGQSANQLIVDAVRVTYLNIEPDPNPPKPRGRNKRRETLPAR